MSAVEKRPDWIMMSCAIRVIEGIGVVGERLEEYSMIRWGIEVT